MDPLTYLTTPSNNFGGLEWVFFVAQFAVALAGGYVGWLRSDAQPIRAAAMRRLGYALVALGITGVLIGALRLAGVPPFGVPLWITIVTVLEALLAIYVLYYALSMYPAQLAAYNEQEASRNARRDRARPLASQGASAAFESPRDGTAASRRDSRRGRKRKSR